MACNCIATTRNNSSIAQSKSVITLDVSLTPATANYTNGDAVGNSGASSSILTFDCAVSLAGGSATLKQVSIIEGATTLAKNALDLVIVSSGAYTTAADNSQLDANTLNPTASKRVCGQITFLNTDYVTIGSTSAGTNDYAIATKSPELKVWNNDTALSNSVYGFLVYRGASQFAASTTLVVRCVFERD
jgi:hypothetical protein